MLSRITTVIREEVEQQNADNSSVACSFGAGLPGSQPPQLHSAPAPSSSHQTGPATSQQQRDGSNWQTVRGGSSRPKGARRTDDSNGPSGTRAAPAYASASPFDFQEPWRDGPFAPGVFAWPNVCELESLCPYGQTRLALCDNYVACP